MYLKIYTKGKFIKAMNQYWSKHRQLSLVIYIFY